VQHLYGLAAINEQEYNETHINENALLHPDITKVIARITAATTMCDKQVKVILDSNCIIQHRT